MSLDEYTPEPRGRGLYKRIGGDLLFAEVGVFAPGYTVTVADYVEPVEGWTLFENETAAEAAL